MLPEPPPAPRRAGTPLAVAAVALVVLGLGLWALSRVVADGGPHAYDPGAQAPYSVTLEQGAVYRIAVPGGRPAAAALGLTLETLKCTLTAADGDSQPVTVTPDSTKATDQLVSFVSPLTGRVHVACTGLSRVFVAGNDEPYDTAGLLLVLATIALTIGIALLLSVLRSRPRPVTDTVADDLVVTDP